MDGLNQSINLIFYVVDELDGFFDGWIEWIFSKWIQLPLLLSLLQNLLVFSLHIKTIVHLIFVTLTLFSCCFLTAKHFVPYKIACLTVIQWNFSLNLSRTFASHKTPYTFLHFNHSAWIQWFTSPSISSSFYIIDPRYLNCYLRDSIVSNFHL